MIRPTFEVADILRVQGDRFLDRYRSSFGFQQLKAFRAIQRCRTAALGGHRDACPSCGHQAISYNSCRNRHCPKCQTQARERWLAARERELLTTSYFPCCVHCASRTQCAGLGEPAFVLRPAVHRQCTNLARDRHRSQTPGRRDRRDRHPAYLGTEPAPASPHSLRHSRRRTLARSPSLDPPTLSFLLTRQGPQPRLSWQVLGWSETSPPSPPTLLRWSHRRSGRPATVCKTHAPPASPRLGRLCQTRLRWSPAGVTLSRPLHPSRGDFQSSLVGLRPGARHLSLEGLCSRWQARQDDSCRHRVPASFLSARSSQRVRAHPSLRVPGESLSRFPPGTIPTTAVQQFLHAGRSWNLQSFGGEFFCLALPTLRRNHDRGAEIYGCGIIHMHLLRFIVARASLLLLRCAPAHRRIRVPTPRRHTAVPRSAHTSEGICDALSHHHATGPVHQCSPSARFCDRLPLKSHSAPRPPQTPAASS